MRFAIGMLLIVAIDARVGLAQVGGNVGYGPMRGRESARESEGANRRLTAEEMPPTDTTMFVDASILMNVKADQFVATFGLAEQAESVEACQAKLDATIAAFTDQIRALGVPPEGIFVDFTAQTEVYDYEIAENVARERLAGFEIKKTVAVRYRDKTLIDRLIAAAGRVEIHDLIKVDSIVTDLAPIQERLAEAAAQVVKAKSARYERLLGIKLRAVPQVYADRSAIHYPTDMYNSYIAGESDAISGGPDRSRLVVESLRKSRTFYYQPLDADGFDRVIEPVILEPVVQFTLYLKLLYEIDTRP